MGKIARFVKSPTGKRVVAWLAPLVVGWIVSKMQASPKQSAGRKRLKNKAK